MAQIAVNMSYLIVACSDFEDYSATLSTAGRKMKLLTRTQLLELRATAGRFVLSMMGEEIRELVLAWDLEWVPSSPPQPGGTDHVREIIRYLTDKFDLLEYLPTSLRDSIQINTVTSMAILIKNLLVGKEVRHYNLYGIMGLDHDLALLEQFADSLPPPNPARVLHRTQTDRPVSAERRAGSDPDTRDARHELHQCHGPGGHSR
eukprot:GAFH01003304.1.p1 GENE.GAFH01003304.1~~GAFH01003304.1.p1  ORF type:complete len:204 (-),score=38.17 GAFH01003304.1:199-810(-)